MTESNRKFFSGRSVEQAVVAAANHYGIHPDEVKYREVEKRHGFVRTRRNAVIAVDPEDFKKSPEERSAARERPRREEPRREGARGGTAPREREAAPAEEPEARERPRRREDRRGRGERPARERRPRDRDRSEPEAERETERRPPRKPTTSGPWWQAEPVTEESEEMEDLPEADEAEGPGPEAPEPEEEGEEERYRFVERSEGLKRREQPGAPVTEAPRGRRAGGRRRPEPSPAAGRDTGEERRSRGPGRGRRGGGGRGRREAPAPAAVAPPPLPRPAPRAERLPRADEELAEAAQDALDRVLEFVGVEAEADFFQNEERLEVELWGPDDHVLLQDDGQILLAIEHLLPRMLRSLYGESMPVRVDCDDFHARREERLRALALETAEEVRRRGKPRTLDELDPAERRIVHLSLADAEDVRTESLGDGYFKRVKVLAS